MTMNHIWTISVIIFSIIMAWVVVGLFVATAWSVVMAAIKRHEHKMKIKYGIISHHRY